MPLSQVQFLVLIIAVLGGWIVGNCYLKLGDQNGLEQHDSLKRIVKGSIAQYVYKHEEDNGVLEKDDNYGIDCLKDLRKRLTYIKCISVIMGTEQIRTEQWLGESLVPDRLYRLELMHDMDAMEGKLFKMKRNEIYPELLNALQMGLTQDMWYLTEQMKNSMHLYSAKLLAYGGRMKTGIENAKAAGKFEGFDWDVTRQLAFLAGAEKCVIEEWFKLNKILRDFLDWVGGKLELQAKLFMIRK